MTKFTETNKADLLAELGSIRQKRSRAKMVRRFSSKVDQYHPELIRLAKDGKSLNDLKTWLAAKGVKASRSTISLALQRGKPSKLDIYKDELLQLADMGASLPDLQAWLEDRDVEVGQTAIWQTIRHWEWNPEEPHFLSPSWKPAKRLARSAEPASKGTTTPSSYRHQ